MPDDQIERTPHAPTRAQMLRTGSSAAMMGLAASTPFVTDAAAPPASQLASYLNLGADKGHLGGGMSFQLGAVYPLTGSGALGISRSTDITALAFKQIKALGGPDFKLVLKDNKSGDPQAGVQAARELGFAKVPMMLSSYAADLAAMLRGIKQYKIFSLDGSGGTSLFAQGASYFWGTIAITPDDALPGAIKYLQAKHPEIKKISSCGWDLGGLSDEVFDDINALFKGTAFTRGVDERTPVGATDYSASIQKIKASNPDIVMLFIYANDVGYFMKQYATSGINKPVFAFAHTDSAAHIAGKAYEGLYFAFDFFNYDNPPNAWGKHLVSSFRAQSGGLSPDYYAANAYEDIFTIWACIRRVLKKGGNPNDGTQLDAALRTNPTFPSVYGTNPHGAGTISFDLTSHSVKARPMTVGQYKGGRVTELAHFDIGGKSFKIV